MTGAGAKPRWRRIGKYLLSLFLAGLLVLGGLAWYVTTNSFQAMVRRRLVAEIEKITGGRVELGSFHTTPFRLRVEVRDLTIHGREKADEVPYAHVARVMAQIKIISALGFEFGFHSLILDHPVIHIVIYPDGSTNQLTPKLTTASGETAVERLFRLSIGQLEVRRGEVLWNDQEIPVDFTVNDVAGEMEYSVLHRRYFGHLLFGKIVTKLQEYRPVAWMAEAHFSLGPESVDVGSLKVSSGRSRLEASGSVRGFLHPEITVKYDAKLDVGEFAAVARRNEPRGGIAEAQGYGRWSLHEFSAAGRLMLKDFGWRGREVNLDKVNANTQFSMTRQRLTLTQLDAHLLGGSVTGNVDVTGWLEPQLSGKATKTKGEEQKGTAQLRVREISAGGLADAISTAALPLNRMSLAGAGSGTIDLRWKGSPKSSEANLVLDVIAPASASRQQLPLSARVRATYRGDTGELEVADFSANTRASQAQAAGRLGQSGALKLSVATSDLGEWQPILAALGLPEKIPATLHGHASFSGTATGTLPNVNFAGNLQAQDFDYLLSGGARSGAQPIHWDSLDANIQLSSRMFSIRNGTLQHGDTRVNFGVTGDLVHWQIATRSSFTARLAVHNAEIAELLSFGGYNYPARGKVNLYLQASGTQSQPQANGRVELSNVNVRGESFQQLDAGVRIDGQQLQLNHIELNYGSARVSGATDYDFSTGTFHVDLSGTNFDLSSLAAGRTGRVQFGGRVDFTAHGSGTREEPVINVTLRLRDLAIDSQRQGDFTLQAVTQGQELHLTGRSQFESADLTLDGEVHRLQDGWPSTLTLHFRHLNLDAPLHPYLLGRLTGPSFASGELVVQGPIRQPDDLSLTGTLNDLALDVENMKLHNQGPIAFAVSNQTLQLKTFRLLGEGTNLSVEGTLQLAGARGLSLRARGQGNLKLLESFDSEFASSGTVDVDMEVTGILSKPVTQGHLQITDGAITYSDLPAAFSEINGSLAFDQNRVQIETLAAHSGGGLVTFGGNAAWINHQLNFDVTLQERDVRLRYPPGISSTANADLHFSGSSSASTLSGDITVTKLSVMPGFDFGAYLARSSRSTALPVTNPTLNRIRLDVHVMTMPELQMQTAVVRLSGDADLRLRGSAAKPVLLGRAEVLEGEVSFNGTKYELERGEVTFQNPVTTAPELDLQATTHVRDYDITLSLNGAPDKLRMTYRSEPPLPEADIITLLALGRTTTESAQLQESGQSSFTQEASSAIISQALNATVTNRAQRLFGVSRIKIDPEGLTSETTLGRGPAVTIEQQVADNLTLTYSTSVEYASQQIIQVVYDLPRNISIVATRDQDGVVSFDLKIRGRKK
jgi:translocation and assembly module TamB